ncbi:MAG: LysM peptidoglycan-binding domain-containing protein [Chitinivibrionales bacterium]|nr:LysM peptidoglycan-binding domain-containing protein [Chitinivibrionales bacterium]
MKKYRVKEAENLGSIAMKYGLPSWKYLYKINEDEIGDNPDLLKPGTELKIPAWDATSGDEKVAEKEADPFAWTGGLRYRYPWVPFSVTVVDREERLLEENQDSYKFKYVDTSQEPEKVIFEKAFSKCDEINVLVPDSDSAEAIIEYTEDAE